VSDVTLTIDGISVTVPEGTTVFDAARMNGIPIPTLCHQQNETPVGVCRVCVVDVVGARVLAASCVRPAENNMKVTTNSDRVLQAQDLGGTADVGPSQSLRPAAQLRRL
jgi:formate dehydrogenase major subunit